MKLSDFLQNVSKAELFNIVVYQKSQYGHEQLILVDEFENLDRDNILAGLVEGLPNADNLKIVIWYSINDDKGESMIHVKVQVI